MGELAKGLMDFSHREVRRTAFGINELVEKTVDFVRPQIRFREWDFSLLPDHNLPRVRIDPGQIQQVLLILLGQIADGPDPTPTSCTLQIRTFSDEENKSVGIEIWPALHGRERPEGLDEGDESTEDGQVLSTVQRILDRHDGRFDIDESEGGDTYRVLLPAA
jgi:nitrogen-specific signal transduction histidine kinase